jgi:ABC-type arginine transport system ATPase subunit
MPSGEGSANPLDVLIANLLSNRTDYLTLVDDPFTNDNRVKDWQIEILRPHSGMVSADYHDQFRNRWF